MAEDSKRSDDAAEDCNGASEADAPTVAVFRPDDERLAEAVERVEAAGARPVADPMLAIEPTGAAPSPADYVVFTSKTGVELAAAGGWDPGEAVVCAIGARTAAALRDAGYRVDLVPEEYSSAGLVAALADEVGGARVEVARSDHGSDVLPDGLADAGADVHETVLYRLDRPRGAGRSASLAAAGDLDAACFSSSLTVEHFVDAATEREIKGAALAGLAGAVVGAIGDPTRATAEDAGIEVDVVPEEAAFGTLVEAVVAAVGAR